MPERKGKQIVATEKGVNLINVVPDEVKSAQLTSDWEMKLQQIENGEYSADRFMAEIEDFIRTLCEKYGSADSSVSFGNNAPTENVRNAKVKLLRENSDITAKTSAV